MDTFSALPITGEFPAQRPVTRSFDIFFDLRLNKRLSKQWWGRWFETPSRPLWRNCNASRESKVGATLSTRMYTLSHNLGQIQNERPYKSSYFEQHGRFCTRLQYGIQQKATKRKLNEIAVEWQFILDCYQIQKTVFHLDWFDRKIEQLLWVSNMYRYSK